jgi:hypothetical protein
VLNAGGRGFFEARQSSVATTNLATIEARKVGCLMPGAFTPTEILTGGKVKARVGWAEHFDVRERCRFCA